MSKMLPVLVIIGVLITIFIFLFDFLDFKNFNIQSEKDCITTQQATEIIKAQKPNLLFINKAEILNALRNKYHCVENANFEASFPTLNIQIKNNLLVARLGDTNIYVNSNLRTMQQGTPSASVPTLYPQDTVPPKPNQTISDKLTVFALNLIKALKDSDFTINNVRVLDAQNIIVYNPQNAIAVFSSQVDLKNQINSLQSVIAKSRIDATKISKIDLRFDKPVVVFK
ncbi:hypothetical protein HY024_01610 [Candidatus Curtissbacteria bacterium]|nr:hypothetical protein [Candidatus Curtissbacteria bacterium]